MEADCLVLGSGIAGLTTAISVAESGRSVCVVTAANEAEECNTRYAQGGIIFDANPSNPKSLIGDILEAGSYLNYVPAVEQLVEKGPEAILNLLIEKAGVTFDRNQNVGYHLTREGGHSENRIFHVADETGKAIQEKLLAYAKTLPQIKLLSKTTAVDLLVTSRHGTDRSLLHEPARCFGAFVFHQETSEVYPIFARHVVLATGGIGQLFLHNTNSKWARGDGIAMASRARCRLANMEYIQFHPTTFAKAGAPRFLISEALRGEGGVLVDVRGERFLPKYLPDFKHPELASRDRVAKAIHLELLASGASSVYLDISHQKSDWIKERFPFVYLNCLKYGVDITKEPIPVVPGAHYHCGGVWVDLQGRTTLAGLWAVGEVSCTGVHGANRLASTSLLEGLVWGSQAGEAIGEDLKLWVKPRFPEIEPWQHETAKVDPAFLSQDWVTLKNTMWNYVGLVKTEQRLSRAEGILLELRRGIDVFYRKARLSDSLIGLRHAAHVALKILHASKSNPKSLGCYQREDWEI